MDELKAMASGGETPAGLAPVMNVLPLYRLVSEWCVGVGVRVVEWLSGACVEWYWLHM